MNNITFFHQAKYQTSKYNREVIQPQGHFKVYVTLAKLNDKIDVYILKI